MGLSNWLWVGFPVTVDARVGVADVPEATNLCRVGAGCSPSIGEIDAVDRQTADIQAPGVDIAAQVA